MAVNDLFLEVEALFKKAEIECNTNAKKSVGLIEEIYSKANKINYEEGMCKALLLLGNANFNMGEYSIADEYYSRCIQLSHIRSIIEIKIRGMKAKADLYLKVRDYDSALEYNFSCLELLSDIIYDYGLKDNVYFDIGVIYKDLGQYDYAIDHFVNAMNICLKNKSKHLLIKIFVNIGLCYIALNNNSLAEEYFISSISCAIEFNELSDLSFAFYGYAQYFICVKEYRKAEEYYIKAIGIQKHNNYYNLLVETMAGYGELYYTNKNYSMAEKIFNDVESILINTNNIKAKLTTNMYLGKIYEKNKQFEKALIYYKKYNICQNEYDNVWKKFKIRNMINKYEIVHSDIKLKELKIANENLRKISDIAKKITSTLIKEEILDVMRLNIFNLVNCDRFTIGLIEKNNILYEIHEENTCSNVSVDINESNSIVAYMVKSKKVVLVNNMSDIHFLTNEYYMKREFLDSIKSMIYCPLVFKDTVLGIISVQSYRMNGFNNNDVEMINILGSYVSIAINNCMQSQKLIVTNERLKELTEKDALTNVYNRYSLAEYASNIIKKANKKRIPYSIVMVDIDFFKEYNDHFGHLEGDKCLIKVSQVLRKSLEDYNTYVYRYGGDEFLILLLNERSKEAYNIVDNVKNKVEQLGISHTYSKCSSVVTITAGLVTINKPIDDFNSIFALADKALYIAKKNGRNRTKQLICS
jgi:diguanylate cyclase (GGDEF)-like protein